MSAPVQPVALRGVRRVSAGVLPVMAGAPWVLSVALTVALGVALVGAGPARAAVAPVTIVYGDLNGFRPPSVIIANGGTVRWTNSGGTTVTISGHDAVCAFTVIVPGFSTSPVIGPFGSSGTCSYTGDTVLASSTGSIVVQPRPGATSRPTPTPTTPGPQPKQSASVGPPGPSAAAPGPGSTSGSGSGPLSSPPTSPSPSAAAGAPSPSPSPPPPPSPLVTDAGGNPNGSGGPASAGSALRTDGVYIGRSPHRAVGLLGAVSLTLVVGLIAGLLRVLLAEPLAEPLGRPDLTSNPRPSAGGSG